MEEEDEAQYRPQHGYMALIDFLKEAVPEI